MRTGRGTALGLGEGSTPLAASVRIGPQMGLDLFFKLETCNPTGSYKDRFVAAEIARLAALGAQACVATSSGNTGSSLAAYAARAGIHCTIVVNQGAPAGKLAQMRAHGAKVIRVKGFVADPSITRRVMETLQQSGRPLVVSAYRYCPEAMAGVETIAVELERQCASAAHIFVPVGGGGLYLATSRGVRRAYASPPRVHAAQPAGCPTLVGAFDRGDHRVIPVQSTTRISGLSVPFDIDAGAALADMREHGGLGFAVSDEEVWEAQRMLLELEGIYCEPAGAAALAGLRRAARRGFLKPGEPAICLVTGHGFKDLESIDSAAARHPSPEIEASQLMAYL
ncbi:MAG: pyridoxal-phosphate dependent enzyme [Bryobacteraceae bacterium]